ncbi:MAG: hypothetical protein F4X58_01070 [Chloroflexi bacterium]|nr:hypothetical protein [Chloroflexota bacterium]MYC00497.1 hypothetical protein [Chloroflexota bacterium]
MRPLLLSAVIFAAVCAGGAAGLRTADAQMPPCTPGSTSPKLTWHERLQSWVVQEFGCDDGSWYAFGPPIHNFNTQVKPGGWYPTWTQPTGGEPVYVGLGTTPLPAFTDSFPEHAQAAIIHVQRLITQTPSANSVCTSLSDAGYNPADVYRIGGNWVYLPGGYAYPDASMSKIWSSITECQ